MDFKGVLMVWFESFFHGCKCSSATYLMKYEINVFDNAFYAWVFVD